MNNDSGGGPQTRRNAVESIVFRPEGEGGGDGRFVFRRRLKMGNRAFIFMLILLLLLLLLLVCPESTMWKCKRGWRRVGGGEGYKHTCSCSLSLSLFHHYLTGNGCCSSSPENFHENTDACLSFLQAHPWPGVLCATLLYLLAIFRRRSVGAVSSRRRRLFYLPRSLFTCSPRVLSFTEFLVKWKLENIYKVNACGWPIYL